jgi:hypothetical protein
MEHSSIFVGFFIYLIVDFPSSCLLISPQFGTVFQNELICERFFLIYKSQKYMFLKLLNTLAVLFKVF